MVGLVIGDDGDGSVDDDGEEQDGGKGWADNVRRDDGKKNHEDERIDIPSEVGLEVDKRIGEFVGGAGERAGEMIGMEGHGLGNDGVHGELRKVFATASVERPV